MKLYICEKPSQGRDLAKILNVSNRVDGYISDNNIAITWAIGHLLQLLEPDEVDAKYSKWHINDLPIKPKQWFMKPNAKTSRQLRVIKLLLQQTQHVVIATDGDREGETIGREILDYCDWSGKVERLWLTALDDKSIKKALANIRTDEQTKPLYFAGLARSRADWLVGMNLTRLLSIMAQQKGHRGVLSVGRVQTPTLAIVVQRDLEIESFISKDYFDVFIVVSGIQAKWYPNDNLECLDSQGRCLNQQVANDVVQSVAGAQATVTVFDTQRKKTPAPLLYSLSILQQQASKKFGFGAKQVLDLAQSLYEKHKATTYPRSDCQYLPKSQLSEVTDVLSAVIKSDPSLQKIVDEADSSVVSRVWNDSKVSAHHGIIPTTKIVDISLMSDSEQKIYDLICRRYIAQFYPSYEYDQTSIEFKCHNELFKTNTIIDVDIGWQVVTDPNKKTKDKKVKPLVMGQALPVDDANIEVKKTKAPPRYNEGTLIAAMEKAHQFVTDERLKKVLKGNEGIGTEATRANIIETIKNRGFIVLSKKQIVSTEIGRSLIKNVPDAVKDPAMTALWESSLSKIETGDISLDDFMKSQSNWLDQLIDDIKQQSLTFDSNAQTVQCPNCQKDMYLRDGKNGKFWACSGYPDCKTTAQNKNGKAVFESDLPKCPKCSKPLRRIKYKNKKTNKNAYFWSCSGYFDTPKCEQTFQDKAGKPDI